MKKIPRYKMESLNLIEMRGKIKEQNEHVPFNLMNKSRKILKSQDFKGESADSQNELMIKS